MILATRAGDRHIRDASVGAMLAAEGLTRGSGTVVTSRSVTGIPAAKEAIRIASEAVAKRELEVYRGTGVERQVVRTTWQSRFFRGIANAEESWFAVKEQTEASLTGRNNALWLKQKNAAMQVVGVTVLDPDCVQARRNASGTVEYRYELESGGWSGWLDRTSVLHFRVGYLRPGCLFAPSPLELHREALRSVLAKFRYEGNLYDEGILQSIAILMGEKVTAEQAEGWRQVFQAEHGGMENRAKVKVIGGGAKVETIGLSLQDAQYVESMQLSVETVANVFGVPASLIGGGQKNTSGAPMSPEHEQMRWFEYGLEPRLARIVSTINADPDFFGPASRDQVGFADVIVRADTRTESEALVREVQAGILLPDEARAIKGRGPHADGVGQIPQITPVGGAPNPNLDVPAAPAT